MIHFMLWVVEAFFFKKGRLCYKVVNIHWALNLKNSRILQNIHFFWRDWIKASTLLVKYFGISTPETFEWLTLSPNLLTHSYANSRQSFATLWQLRDSEHAIVKIYSFIINATLKVRVAPNVILCEPAFCAAKHLTK